MKPLNYLTDNGKKIFKSILDFIPKVYVFKQSELQGQ